MKTKLLSLFGLCLFSCITLAQKVTNEKAKPFATCDKSIKFTADDKWLKEKVALNLSTVDTAATFTGGIDELKKYFAQYRLTDPKSRGVIFTIRISFAVNCKGEAGDFQPLMEYKNKLRPISVEILKIVKNMPQNWKPAIKGTKEVDSYQILEFIVSNGYLDKVSYRQ